MAFTFIDSFPRGASGGFTLEMLSFYIALEKGLNKLPIAVRIKPSATTYPVPTPTTGGIFLITVASISALSAYVVTGLTSGNWLAWVYETSRMYRLDAASGSADGVNSIVAQDGRMWFIT